MLIKNLFTRDIFRSIIGVVKAHQLVSPACKPALNCGHLLC
jgi:hypothetical protein